MTVPQPDDDSVDSDSVVGRKRRWRRPSRGTVLLVVEAAGVVVAVITLVKSWIS
ncbi:hypothetical protein SAMN06264365_104249 [Actinoplanes regularis]|uniref:Uncharacterized protein n=1 Tax=Actinoplanes regularis TaxID=52697 RepID=A0A238Y592_9ACTN|nr:hypothetical protein SAMN06264365_104249 [Actinoplanes regularis]